MKRYVSFLFVPVLVLSLLAGCGREIPADSKPVSETVPVTDSPTEQTVPVQTPEDALLEQMNEIISDPEHPLMAAALGVIRNGKIVFAEAVGSKNLSGEPADADTKYRIASISKLVTAIGAWQLIEQGLIDPDADASEYLGFELRNPNFPDTPITVRMIMSHTSSLRDGNYSIAYGRTVADCFTYSSKDYWAPPEEAPGVFFTYSNMNYTLMGTIIERVSGERFDQYMVNHVFEPMGLSCSFNVADMSEEAQAQIGTLYRKLTAAGRYDPVNGRWRAQCDDFTRGYPSNDYTGYVVGTNGSLFSPVGGLRISVNELCQIMLMFCNGGSHNGAQILKPETVERMFTPVWRYDAQLKNGSNYYGLMNCYGMGPHIFTNTDMGDRMIIGQDLPFVGHTAEAYGLLGGMGFDLKTGNGIVYIAAGTGSDPNNYLGSYSAFYGWEEALLTAGITYADFEY